jgi:transposase
VQNSSQSFLKLFCVRAELRFAARVQKGMSTDRSTLPSDALPEDPELLKQFALQLLQTWQKQERRIEQLEHQIDQLLRRYYGPRSERFDPNQLKLFAGDEAEATPPAADIAVEEPRAPKATAVPRPSVNGHGRRKLPADLPRKRIEHTLPVDQLPCPCCGTQRIKFAEEPSEQLEYEPASLFVVEHVRFKYACRNCQEHVTVADKPPQPIDKGLPGPGLLAFVTVSKQGDHLPLYRQEEIFARHGVDLSRSTLCGWLAECAALLQPLYALMIARVLQSKVLHTDDTTVPVLDPALPHTRTGRFWLYFGDRNHYYAVYQYTPNRKRDGPAAFLANYQGYLQADAFGGYDGIYAGSGGKIIEVACWAHARRKFYDAQRSSGAVAHEALARIGQLYAIEREMAEACSGAWSTLSAVERAVRVAEVRQERAKPLLQSFEQWLGEQRAKALPKSPIGQAIGYALSNWTALCRYTEHGDLAIDNNLAERTLRPQAIGRKNWLFAGSEQGARTAAVLFTMVASAKANGVDPFAYLRDLYTLLPLLAAEGKTAEADLTALLPNEWLKAHPQATFTPNRSP